MILVLLGAVERVYEGDVFPWKYMVELTLFPFDGLVIDSYGTCYVKIGVNCANWKYNLRLRLVHTKIIF